MKILIILFFIPFLNAAYIYDFKGEVYFKSENSKEWKNISNFNRVNILNGDEIKTKRASMAIIYMDDGSKIKLSPFSYFKLEEENKAGVKVNLFFGKVRNWVKKFSKKFEVKTPTAVCAVRGTDFVVMSDMKGNSRIEVYEGSVLTGDSFGKETMLRKGQFIDVNIEGGLKIKKNNNLIQNMNSGFIDSKIENRKEIYTEISKNEVLKRAQMEIESAEYKNRKTAIDAFGNRVRIEEYISRPSSNQFKYVVLNTRENNFNFGKILFTFNDVLPQDLSLATKNMLYYEGSIMPKWYLTDLNSVMSNTLDKVTEDASGGIMIADNSSNPNYWTHFFSNYGVYFAGPNEGSENNGLGRLLWKYNDINNDKIITSGEYTFLGNKTISSSEKLSDYQTKYNFNDGSYMLSTKINPNGDDTFDNIVKNEYSDGTYINTRDFVIFDDGKIASINDFNRTLTQNDKTSILEKLNFERVYESSLFSGRKIDLEFSAKLLKDAGMGF